MDAFDADCLIYAAVPDHPLGAPVFRLLTAVGESGAPAAGVGSVLLIPELLSKPLREHRTEETHLLSFLLSRLDLHPADRQVADLATALGARYRLKAVDAIHLGTAVRLGADRFITNNRRDFRKSEIRDLDITYPGEL